MKKFFLSLTLVFASLAAWAEAGFYVEDSQGVLVGYVFMDQPVWTFEGDNLVISTVGGSVEYPMSYVAKIFFGDTTPTGLLELDIDEMIRVIPDGVELSGFAANTLVTIHNLQGQQLGAYRTSQSGSLNISLAEREQGIYLIHANKSTIKIKK